MNLHWLAPPSLRTGTAKIRYTGPLAAQARDLVLHLGHDGWSAPYDVPMDRLDDRSWIAEVPVRGQVIDCVVRDGDTHDVDNNSNVDYRLWINVDPVDAHVHVRTPGGGSLGFTSMRTALHAGGMTHAVVSWMDNELIDLVAAERWLTPLVWVRPGGPSPGEVRRRLASGAAGLKLHPAYDNYPADTHLLDPYLTIAAEAGTPVTIHSSPGPADPDLIRRLAERFPAVRFVLYHTYLGPPEGRHRAARHAQRLPNLYLETSWCRSAAAERLIDKVGPDRVLFGSDAATDGPEHYTRHPPNIEMVESYNSGLLRLAHRLPTDMFRRFVEDNARELFGIPRPAPPLAAEDLRALLAAALTQLRRVLSAVRTRDLDRPTPCASWDVRTLLGHVLAVVQRAQFTVEGRPVMSIPDIMAIEPSTWREVLRAAVDKAIRACTARPAASYRAAPHRDEATPGSTRRTTPIAGGRTAAAPPDATGAGDRLAPPGEPETPHTANQMMTAGDPGAAGPPIGSTPGATAADAGRDTTGSAGDWGVHGRGVGHGAGSVAAPWGRMPAAVALSGFVVEVAVHTWDLAAGVAARVRLDGDVAAAAMGIAVRLVPPETRDGHAFDGPVAAAPGADASALLAAYLGRRAPT
ncbi:amidohydrolase family protein [Actinoplanes sp. N902-109]|uniref:amidohydrolase family protein n=1 Tax=Actinoplanes sp. (strain N902-109) TaxID=649831 RepID=UPI00032947C5|nr:amidohydrolase family protein [Actinoplanes sp. N902-109]AGL17074.1 metal-dependent hydrolase [Actinoplanes sp. N902-109]